MQTRRVVITGMGAVTPIGIGVPAFRDALFAGVSGAAPITHFDASKFRTRFACEVKNFDITQYMSAKEARKMDPFAHYIVAASDEAMADAGDVLTHADPYRVGVVVGSGIGGLVTFTEQVREFSLGDGTPRFNPFFVPKMIIDIAAGHVSIKYGLKGPNYSCISACATSNNCIIDGFLLIRNNLADVMVVGGGEAAVNESGIGGFNAMKALSERNDAPETASRPFDVERDGFVMGEGGGILILEEYEPL